MNKKALYGLLIAILLPLVCYFILKKESDDAVVMPRHYIPDSTFIKTKNGKQYSDTAWHTIPDFVLTNQLGDKVSWKDMQWEVDEKKEGKIVVADFFFTHCPNICPTVTRAMKLLQNGIKSSEKVGSRDPNFIQFLSFSIDPERDSVPQLKKWGDQFQINPQEWWLLTGDKKIIYDLSIKDMMLMAEDGKLVDSNFLHTDMLVLIDKNRHIRGYYHALDKDKAIDTATLAQLSQDIVLLSMEKDPNKKSVFAGKLELIAVVFSIAAIGLILMFIFLKRENRKI